MERKIILALLGFGMLITLSGFLLLLLPKEFLKNNMRFITPLPPIAVAVYVYISKAVELKFDTTASFFYEIVRMSFYVGVLYFVFALLLFLFVKNA